MASSPAELPIATWAPSTSPLRIEYAKPVMEEVRARAVEGFYRLARGGVEVAGLLLGEQRGDTIRILAQQPFEIEYAFGPAFLLSPRDHVFLRKLLEDVRAEAAPLGHKVLGLYISHSRGELCLNDNDQALFGELFPHSWQTVLVLKPTRMPETPAAFFVREPNGQVRANRSHQEFELAPDMGERRVRPPRSARPEDASLRALATAATRTEASEPIPAARALDASVPPAAPKPPAPRPAAAAPNPQAATPPAASPALPLPPQVAARTASGQPVQNEVRDAGSPESAGSHLAQARAQAVSPPSRHTPAPARIPAEDVIPASNPGAEAAPAMAWEDEPPRTERASSPLRFAIPAIAALLVAVLGYLLYLALTSSPPKVVFYKQDLGDRLEVVWQLSGIRDATTATITIENNGQRKSIDLIRTGQLSGTYTDPLLTPDAVVTLEVERTSAPAIQRVAPLIRGDSALSSLTGAPSGAESRNAEVPPGGEAASSGDGTGGSVEALPAATSQAAVGPAPQELLTASQTQPPAPNLSVPLPPARETPVPVPPASSPLTPAAGGLTSLPGGISPSTAATAQPVARTPDTRPAAEPPPIAETAQRTPASAAPEVTVPPRIPPAAIPPAAIPPAAETPSPVKSQAPAPGAASPAAPLVAAPKTAEAKPAAPARPQAGRVIWTGQLRKNQVLQLNGGDASQGALNGSLPGQPIRLNVLPGELTPQGLVVYTANPRYRDAANATEEPGPTNGWNRTRYRYDPVRANSVIVTAIPNQTNRWQGLTVRNDDKTVNVIVIDWLAERDN